MKSERFGLAASKRPSVAAADRVAPRSEVAPVDYSLSRNATLRAWRAGQLQRNEVCDAQSELQRNAEWCGQPTDRDCPVCAAAELVEVTYVFGPRLPKHGRCITTHAEMERLKKRVSSLTGYVVEVCRTCGWNHLIRRLALGGKRSA